MKGLNVKRIAAIGLGAALVGSALAPVVSAANVVPTGLDELGRDTVITATGAPAVDIVVGANASVSDVVWAGNIAARVAQLATKPVTCSASSGTVDLTVGGTSSLSGVGKTQKENFDYVATEYAPANFTIKNGTLPLLAEELTWEYKVAGTTSTIAVKETVAATMDAQYQSRGNGVYPGEIAGNINQNGIVYKLDLGAGIPVGYNADTNSNSKVTLPILGETYTVRSVNTAGTILVLEKDTAAVRLDPGQSVDVDGTGSYAGKKLKLVLAAVEATGTGTQDFVSTWELMDGTTVISTKTNIGPSADLKETFSDYMNTTVYISSLVSTSGDVRYARITAGQDRLEIRNDKAFPYDASAKSSDPIAWKANVNVVGGKVTYVEVKNDALTYRVSDAASSNLQGTGSDKHRMGPLPQNGEVDVLGLGKVKLVFQGLEDKQMFDVQVGGENLKVRIDDAMREIPLAIGPFGDGLRTVTIAGKQFSVDVNAQNFTIWDGVISSSASDAYGTLDDSAAIVNKGITGSTLDFATDLAGLATVSYYGLADQNRGDYWLVLGNQTFTLDIDSSASPTLALASTYSRDANATNGNTVVPYYLPDVDSINNLIELVPIKDGNLVGDYKPGSSKNQFQALFNYVDPSTAESVKVFINTANNELSNPHADSVTKVFDGNGQVYDGNWKLDSTTTTAADKLLTATTEYGTEVMIDGQVAKFSIPTDRRQLVAFLGGSEVAQVVTGGASYTGVAAGETKGNVTVTAVNCGGSGASAVEVVPVSNLVKTAKGSGKSIIVGGWVANAAAKNLEVSGGKSLNDLIVNSGDYVAAVLASGDIVVAGFNGNDTGRAAQDLISALDAELAK